MKKLLVSLMAMAVVSIGVAAQAGPLSDALNNAAKKVDQHEQALDKAQKDAEARQQAREEARQKQREEWQKRQEERQKELQKKKDAWNTLIGK